MQEAESSPLDPSTTVRGTRGLETNGLKWERLDKHSTNKMGWEDRN